MERGAAVGIQLHMLIMSTPLFVLLLLCLAALLGDADALILHDFPNGFIFGTGNSALQVEGTAAKMGGSPASRIPHPSSMASYSFEKSIADVLADRYHNYKDDVTPMNDMGLDTYRFSIAWPRLIPDGRGEINLKGLEYYNNLIEELIWHGHNLPFGSPSVPSVQIQRTAQSHHEELLKRQNHVRY